jgi:hypothetical protein
MTAPRFDPDDIMRAVRAAAKPSSPATTATLLQNEPNRSNVAIVAASPESTKAIYAEKSPPQVEITQASNHGARPAEISSVAGAFCYRLRHLRQNGRSVASVAKCSRMGCDS